MVERPLISVRNEGMEATGLFTRFIAVVCGERGTKIQKPTSTVLWSAFKSRVVDLCPRERPSSRQPQGIPPFLLLILLQLGFNTGAFL